MDKEIVILNIILLLENTLRLILLGHFKVNWYQCIKQYIYIACVSSKNQHDSLKFI